jgi:hypothetical protein
MAANNQQQNNFDGPFQQVQDGPFQQQNYRQPRNQNANQQVPAQNGQQDTIPSQESAYSSELPPQTQGDSTAQLKAVMINYYGIPADIVNAASPSLIAFMGSVAQYNYNQAANGQSVQSVNAGNILDAYNKAAADPLIQTQFSDQLALDKSNVTNSLAYLNTVNQVQQATNAAKFRADQMALNQNNANAGIAESGFAKQAKQDLSTEQQGVIQSANATNRKQIQQLGAGIESTYGTNGLGKFGPLNVGGQVYNPATGVYGTQPVAQQNATIAGAQKNYGMLQYPGSQGSSASS